MLNRRDLNVFKPFFIDDFLRDASDPIKIGLIHDSMQHLQSHLRQTYLLRHLGHCCYSATRASSSFVIL